jgi:PhnB protein
MTTQVKSIPDGYRSVTLCLTLKNSATALEFYKKAFGAEVLEVIPSPDGRGTMHAAIMVGDSILMMGDEMPNPECSKSAESLGASPISLYLYVPDVDAAFKQAVAAGAAAVMPVTDMFWGDRCGTLKDPFGYTWMIGTHVRDLTQKEIQEGARDFCAQAAKR